MFRLFSTVLIILLFYPSALAAVGDLELKNLSTQKKEIDPGGSLNLLVSITNKSNISKEVQIKLKSTVGNLKLITNNSSIQVDQNTTLNKIVGIQIPSNFDAGNYKIELEGLEKGNSESFSTIEFPILVKAKYEIAILKLKTPPYVFSGEEIKMSYLVQNLSNIEVKIKTTTIKGPDNQVAEYVIPKDSSIVLEKTVKTEKKVDGFSSQSVIFMAQIIEKPEIELSVYTSVDIFPSEVIKFDKYERFPVSVSTILATSNRLGKQITSGMYDVQGIGSFGKNSENYLDFHLRGPDRSGNPLFGMNDEYYLKYRSKLLSAVVGDYSFGLSELTESSRSGRGIALDLKLNKFTIGGYYNLPKYYPLIKQVGAVSSNFALNPKNGITLGFLYKVDTSNVKTQLYTFSSQISPFSWLSTETEVAFGQNKSKIAKAYKTTLHLNLLKFNTHIVYLYADPEFLGFINNSLRYNIGSSIQLSKVSLSVNYDMNSTNMALDTLFSNMPYSKNINISASYRHTPQNTLTISFNNVSLKDKSPTPLFDYTKKSGRFTIQSKLKSLNISLMGDVGSMNNLLGLNGPTESLIYGSTLSMFYFINKKYGTSAFASYQGGGQKNVTGNKQFYYGTSITANLDERLTASIQYNSNYEWKYYTSDRSLFSLTLNGRLNENNDLNISANYNLMKNTLDSKEYNVQLRYIHRLNMPIGKKKNIGSVSGKIINHGVEKINGIRLNINGQSSISDKEGNFKFTTVPVGNHILTLNTSILGLNAVTEIPGPFKILVEPSKTTIFDFSLTTSGRITGRIVVQEDERSNQKGFIAVKENIEKLIIEASSDSYLFRIYTDKEGNFSFDDLIPGKWQIKIYPKGLPAGYTLATSIYNIDLTSGKHENIDVIIQKKARQIQFQKL